VIVAIVGLGLGIFGAGFTRLLASNLLRLLAASALFAYLFRRDFSAISQATSRGKKALACRYKRYPLHSAGSAIVDGMTMSLTMFFLARKIPDRLMR
jgi:hypothetical protein